MNIDWGKVQALVFDLYDRLTVKENDQQLTVVAAIVLIEKSNAQPKLVSFGSGTKCVSQAQLDPSTSQLRSCHAEVIAKRGFQLFLIEEISQGDNSKILKLVNDQWCLPDHHVLLYTSQPPCGQCTIAPDSKVYGLSGAKPIDGVEKGMLTLRNPPCSSRATAPQQQCPSLCCSDKLMLWSVLGIQGSLLSSLMEPIYITHLMVEVRDIPIKASIKQGIDVQRRLGKRIKIELPYRTNRPRLVYSMKNFFKHNEQNKRLVDQGGIRQDQQFQSYSYSWVTGQIEKINSLNGLKWGIAKKDQSRDIAQSRLSRKKMAARVEQMSKLHKGQEKGNYASVKQKIRKLFM